MDNSLQATTPGFGMAGIVICPVMSITHQVPCVKSACEYWVELTYSIGKPEQKTVGRCAVAWSAVLQAEGNQQFVKLNENIEKLLRSTDASPS